MTSVRLDRLLSNLGYGSRKAVVSLIKAGHVTRGGLALKDPGLVVPYEDASKGAILFKGEVLEPLAPLTLMLHKPRGFTCSHGEEAGGALIYDFLPPRWRERKPALSTAGRLDKDSSGQVLITDDGDLLHKIISPHVPVEKHYRVSVCDPLSGEEEALFSSGTFLIRGDDKPLKPAFWTPDGPKSGIMVLHEGRYHQIRRMFGALGNKVESLHRLQTGGLALGDLPEGAYRVLNADEIQRIFDSKIR